MKTIILLIITLTFLLDIVLSILNYRFRDAEIPEEVIDVYDTQTYKNWQKYNMENFRLTMISSIISFIIIFCLLLFNVFKDVYLFVTKITSNIHLQALFLVGFYFIIEYIIGIFFSYYHQFSIEERYGFNKSTIKTFIIDKIKSLLLTIILGGSLFFGFSTLYHNYGKMFYLYGFILIIIVVLLLNILYIKLFVPLFNKLTPLEEGELKTEIETLANKVGYEVKKISIMDASKRSTKLNAFFTGFGKLKHIVLFDTLINKMTTKQILTVLAHEIGHAKKKHTLKNLFLSFITISIYLLVLNFCVQDKAISSAFGFENPNFGFGMLIFFYLLMPISIVTGAILNPIYRKFEYDADYYAAVNTSKADYIEALKILARENFANLTPHPFYVQLKYTHPPIACRIRAVKNIN